jgi:membrane peptidoglycan carboxypeptidase
VPSPLFPSPGRELPPLGAWSMRFGALIVGVIASILALSLVAQALAAGAVRSAASSVDVDVVVPDANVLPELEERSVVFSSDGLPLATLHEAINRKEVAFDAVPDHVWQALVTAEDRKFFEHEGYDVEGIGRAALANIQARGIAQGGSTITQQLAKSTVGSDRTFERKIEELLQAMALEEQHSKEELLERYLNQVYFGAGAYGIAAAAEEFFAMSFDSLRVEQAALLAALVRAPGSNDPRRNPDRARVRRDAVLLGMVEEGYLDSEEVDFLISLPLGIVPARQQRAREPYIVEAVKQEFFNNPVFGETRGERIDALFSGGLQVFTTIDPDLQDAAERIVREYYPERDGVTASIASVDPRTGEVKAAAFGRDFDQEQFNLALQGRRQPGSSFKPFVAATALEQGFPPSITLEGTSGTTFGEGILPEDDPWVERGVSNYGDSSFADLNMRESLIRSVNTAFAQLILLTGVEPVQEMTDRLGISRAAYAGVDNLSMALGGLERGITPMEMASAYGVFGASGVHNTPHVISRVVDQDGEEIYNADGNPEQAVRPDVAAEMTDIMKDVVQRGTGTRAQIPGWEVAGKTGTTQNNRDVWFVGYTPVLSTAVWVGHPDLDVTLGAATGGQVAAPMWQDFMAMALEGIEPVPFPDADLDLTPVRTGEEVTVPDVRQLTEGEAAQALVAERLIPDLARVASGQPRGTVLSQSPAAGSTATVGDTVRISISTGRPPPPPPPPPRRAPAPAPAPPAPAPAPAPAPPPPAPEPATEPEADPGPAAAGAPEDLPPAGGGAPEDNT